MRNRPFRAVAAAIVTLGACAPLLLSQLPGSANPSVRITTLTACRAGLTGRVVVVNDAASTSDCTVGGATGDAAHRVLCICDVDGAGGFLWRAGAGGGGGGGGVGGSTGADDNRLLRADGTGGATLQASLVTVDDAGAISGLTQATVDNVGVNGNTISATSGDLTLAPASGLVNIDGASLRIMSGVPVLQFAFNGSFVSLKDTGKVSWSPSGNATETPDLTVERGTAGVFKVTTRILLVPTSGVTCDAGSKGMAYVASGDGTWCTCNGTVWTPTPLTGTCN